MTVISIKAPTKARFSPYFKALIDQGVLIPTWDDVINYVLDQTEKAGGSPQ